MVSPSVTLTQLHHIPSFEALLSFFVIRGFHFKRCFSSKFFLQSHNIESASFSFQVIKKHFFSQVLAVFFITTRNSRLNFLSHDG